MRGSLGSADRPHCPSLTILHVQSGFWAPVWHTAVPVMCLRTAVSAATRCVLHKFARPGSMICEEIKPCILLSRLSRHRLGMRKCKQGIHHVRLAPAASLCGMRICMLPETYPPQQVQDALRALSRRP